MNRFEDQPANVRALLLAKLAIELKINRCTSLYELAKRHNTDMIAVWRDVCRLSKQPACTIPQAAVLQR
jgi:hypothetical protein